MNQAGSIRRPFSGGTSRYLSIGPFTLDRNTHRLAIHGVQLDLPPCTFEYLATLVQNSPHPVSYQDLVWESQGAHLGRLDAQDLVRSKIFLLRKFIEPDPETPQFILAVSGYGYRLCF
jgi:two-component system response regulator RegX3